MSEKISVKMGEFRVASNNAILESVGVGSCVVVCLYDAEKRLGGLAHVMLPGEKGRYDVNMLRFAVNSIKAVVQELRSLGCKSLTAKIFGGASMFQKVNSTIGDDNVRSVRKILGQERVRIVAEDVGGNQGRSVWFDLSTGAVVVGKVYGETKEY